MTGDGQASPQQPKSARYGAFFMHWRHLLVLAADAARKAHSVRLQTPGAWPAGEALSAIMFSVLSTEAFINELAEASFRDSQDPDRSPSSVDVAILRDLAVTLDLLVKAKASIQIKYQLASKILSGRTLDPGRQPYQDFNRLIRLRNDLVHPKHSDDTTAEGYIEPRSDVVRYLRERGFTNSRKRSSGGISWLNDIESDKVARWAYETAFAIITAIRDLLPEDDLGSTTVSMTKTDPIHPLDQS